MTARTLSALAILVLGLGTALIGLAGTSSAIEEVGDLPTPVTSDADDCEPFAGAKAFYSDWADDGAPVKTEENSAPAVGDARPREVPVARLSRRPGGGHCGGGPVVALESWRRRRCAGPDRPAPGGRMEHRQRQPRRVPGLRSNQAINVSNEHSGNSSWFFHEKRDAVPGRRLPVAEADADADPGGRADPCVAGSESSAPGTVTATGSRDGDGERWRWRWRRWRR